MPAKDKISKEEFKSTTKKKRQVNIVDDPVVYLNNWTLDRKEVTAVNLCLRTLLKSVGNAKRTL